MFPASAATAASVGILGKGPHVFRLQEQGNPCEVLI